MNKQKGKKSMMKAFKAIQFLPICVLYLLYTFLAINIMHVHGLKFILHSYMIYV